MENKIYQIKILLKGSKPPIWRRILIYSNTLLSELHNIIQQSMGWYNCHLHQFIQHGVYYLKIPTDGSWEDHDDYNDVDYEGMRVSSLLGKEKDKMVYEYDFGDSWEHTITLEKILPIDNSIKYPVCTGGRLNCPPEDCGGVWGYEEMLEILTQPDHEEYDEYLEWIGTDFDPKYFNIDEVNDRLHTKDFDF